MADTSYDYVIVDEFPNDVAEPEVLELEILNSDPAITSATLLGTACDGDPQSPTALTTLKIWFDGPLSGADETQLDALVAAHQGVQNKDIDTRGAVATTDKFILQSSSDKTDESIALSKDGSGNMLFQDSLNESPVSLTTLLSGGGVTEGTHKTLRQLIHFIDNGPAEGFLSGAYREILPAGNPFPTSVIWYEDSTKAKKIVERTKTYSGAFPQTIEWKVYDTDGTTVLATVTDTITYSGAFETSREREIA